MIDQKSKIKINENEIEVGNEEKLTKNPK